MSSPANPAVRTFAEDNELLPLYVEVGDCVFPEAGQYSFEVYFSAPGKNKGDAAP